MEGLQSGDCGVERVEVLPHGFDRGISIAAIEVLNDSLVLSDGLFHVTLHGVRQMTDTVEVGFDAQNGIPNPFEFCGNLPSNGRTARNVAARLGALHSRDLGAYISGAIAFPSTMLDRIVPATTDADSCPPFSRGGTSG